MPQEATLTAAPLLAAFLDALDETGDPLVTDFAGGIDRGMEERPLSPRDLPCLRFLPGVAGPAPGGLRRLAGALSAQAPTLHWRQTYKAEDFGQRFLDNYGWIELFGTRGHFANDRIAGGFLLLGPETSYPDHHHVAEEIYIPLTSGTEWSMAGQPFATRAAGEIIHHASDVPHAMRTGAAPLLALYLWRGGVLDQRPKIVGR